jgi:hypothetical protein
MHRDQAVAVVGRQQEPAATVGRQVTGLVTFEIDLGYGRQAAVFGIDSAGDDGGVRLVIVQSDVKAVEPGVGAQGPAAGWQRQLMEQSQRAGCRIQFMDLNPVFAADRYVDVVSQALASI